MGERYTFDFEGGDSLARTLAAFYWGTLLPGVIERTRARDFPVSDGYVLSSLSPYAYAGTYPDVDHEFQIKGRLAMGDTLNEAIVRRMIELQLKLMRGTLRVCGATVRLTAVRQPRIPRTPQQPGWAQHAEMFLITGKRGMLRSRLAVRGRHKDKVWLAQQIPDLEGAASCIEDQIDRQGRLWSDVVLRGPGDQDGRVCDAQAFAPTGSVCWPNWRTNSDAARRLPPTGRCATAGAGADRRPAAGFLGPGPAPLCELGGPQRRRARSHPPALERTAAAVRLRSPRPTSCRAPIIERAPG